MAFKHISYLCCLLLISVVCVQSATKKNYLIQFWFYSQEPHGGLLEALSNYNDSKVFDPKLPTKIVIHGFKGTCSKVASVLEAFQEVGRSNNICVDWDGKTSAKEFFDARNLVPLIALYVANMVNDVKMNPVHCVGHSLGAHICHMAAAKLKEMSGRPMQRLTLCDPAVLQSDMIEKSAKQIPNSAEISEVIHTNIESPLFAGISGQHFGYSKPMGDYDFYPNGGLEQPSCNKKLQCEHAISYQYYANAIRKPMAYPAFKCTSVSKAKKGKCEASQVFMGNSDTYNAANRGIYWLSTVHENWDASGNPPTIKSKL